jgi:transposase
MNTTNRTITNERVDDIPVLLAQQNRMGVAALLNKHFVPHGHWQGASLGEITTVWLSYVLSEGDHRLNYVEEWVSQRLTTLRQYGDETLTVGDFRDDRLAIILRLLSDGPRWNAFEQELNQHTMRVYDLKANRIRLDSTTASGYWTVTEDGLFQFGHSKDHRPDLPQLKVMLATLDPLGMPLVTTVVAGQRADDPLYVPAIAAVRQSLERSGLLFIGDVKMAAMATRTVLQAGGDYYLCPLSEVQVSAEQLAAYLDPLWANQCQLTAIERTRADGEQEHIADGFEVEIPHESQVGDETLRWTERQLVVRSRKLAQAQEASLRRKVERTRQAIAALGERQQGKARLATLADYQQAVAQILQRHATLGLVQVDYQVTVQQRSVRQYKDRPARVEQSTQIAVTVAVDEPAVDARVRSLGWRVYATNAPTDTLSLEQAVLAYREQYIEEHAFGRLKGKPLSLTPMYLQRDDHATGLVHLLSLGLRILTVTQYTVRQALQTAGTRLAGIFAGNPKRATAQPTAERLLAAFKDITLTVLHEPAGDSSYLTPLSPIQSQILALMGFSDVLYLSLVFDDS